MLAMEDTMGGGAAAGAAAAAATTAFPPLAVGRRT